MYKTKKRTGGTLNKAFTEYDFIDRLARKNITPEEELALEQWLQEENNRAVFEEAKNIHHLLGGVKGMAPQKTQTQLWAAIDERLQKNKAPSRRSAFTYFLLAAAAVLLLAVFWNLPQDVNPTPIQTQRGQITKIELPDGSNVILNAESQIRFQPETWSRKRHIELEGEAFFDVKKGSDFTVKTKSLSVLVLGTAFNVYARDDQSEVAVDKGRVEVMPTEMQNDTLKKILLEAGQVATLEKQGLRIHEMTSESIYFGWQNQHFVFQGLPLHRVFSILSRQYDVDIHYPQKFSEQKFTGSFEKQSLPAILDVISISIGVDYTTGSSGSVIFK